MRVYMVVELSLVLWTEDIVCAWLLSCLKLQNSCRVRQDNIGGSACVLTAL